jgi:hypothetical protein
VLGIDRGARRQALLDGGADIVVEDLAEYARPLDHEATPR